MGKNTEESRNEILLKTTESSPNSSNCNYFSKEELSELQRYAEELFKEAFRNNDFKTTNLILDLQEQIKNAQQGQRSNSQKNLQKILNAIQVLSSCSTGNSTKSSWYRALEQRLLKFERSLSHHAFQQTNDLDRGESDNIREFSSFFDNIETPDDSSYDDVFPGYMPPQILNFYKKKAFYSLRKGKALLNNKALLLRLEALREQTCKDKDKMEYYATGKVDSDFPWDTEGIRGTTRQNGIKTTEPHYERGASVYLHSHPNQLPLSLNDFDYGGNIHHSRIRNKNVFVITTQGDIYFTEPGLASFDFTPNGLPYSGYRQVYLGDIEDFFQ